MSTLKASKKFFVDMLLGAIFFCAFLFSACSEISSSSSVIPSESSSSLNIPVNLTKYKATMDSLGFVFLSPQGQVIVLGTNDSTAVPLNRPQMNVTLDYDFFMLDHEITSCEQSQALGSVALDCNPYQSGPVSNGTYFDAVIFANAFSKMHGLDTVYTYTKAKISPEGRYVELENFKTNFEVAGFRLPTEAEWVFAAGELNPESSWNNSNSNYMQHIVHTMAPNRYGIYDMAGNVSEWVNDWACKFKDTTINNYVGAPDGGALGERIIKGGNFRSPPSAINFYSRGDVYKVTSTSVIDYVGFRICFGPIANPVWLDGSGKTSTNPITPVASTDFIKSLTGSFNTKIAFRNDESGNIAYIDYSNGVLSIIEINDSINSYHPDISPNGKWVAFCTGTEGVSSKSEVYVRQLTQDGKNLVKLPAENAAIPRWRITPEGDTTIVYVTNAISNTEASWKTESTWQVSFANGAFGIPQKLFDGAYHGGISEDGTIAVTGARTLLALNKGASETWYNGEQACNASLSHDGSKRTLFLDFAGKTGTSFTNSKYNVHEVLFVVDSTGALIKSIKAPNGYTFDHSEWILGKPTTGMDIAITTLTNADGAHNKIALINMNDGTVTPLIEGQELWHPCLWVKTSNSTGSFALSPDSAGVYYADGTGVWANHKMRLFFANHETIEVVAVGSSRTGLGFDPTQMKFGKALNMAFIPCDMYMEQYLVNNYILPHVKNLKVIALGIDFDLWYYSANNAAYLNFGTAPGYYYDANHNFWKDGLPEGFVEKVEESPSVNVGEYETLKETMGFTRYEYVGSWYAGAQKAVVLNGDSTWSDNKIDPINSIAMLRQIIEIAKQKDVLVVGIIYPQSPGYKNTGTYGRHGMRRSFAKTLYDSVLTINSTYDNFILMNENKWGEHDYADSLAYDSDHLNYRGAKKLTERLDSLLFATFNSK